MKIYLTAKEIRQSIRSHFSGQGVTVLSEVRNGAGFQSSVRTADMLAVSTWPSRGLYAEGIEIKCSGTDLLRELALPEKAEAIAKYCQRWWLATPEGLSDGITLPPKWGVIEAAVEEIKKGLDAGQAALKAIQKLPKSEAA